LLFSNFFYRGTQQVLIGYHGFKKKKTTSISISFSPIKKQSFKKKERQVDFKILSRVMLLAMDWNRACLGSTF
jgi:hypothetical protein